MQQLLHYAGLQTFGCQTALKHTAATFTATMRVQAHYISNNESLAYALIQTQPPVLRRLPTLN